jgi:hypothetical protein
VNRLVTSSDGWSKRSPYGVITVITIEIAPRIEPDILPISKMGNRVVSLEPTKSIPSAKKPFPLPNNLTLQIFSKGGGWENKIMNLQTPIHQRETLQCLPSVFTVIGPGRISKSETYSSGSISCYVQAKTNLKCKRLSQY